VLKENAVENEVNMTFITLERAENYSSVAETEAR
jgi:hypothetical protein